jgi:hypothetical protein
MCEIMANSWARKKSNCIAVFPRARLIQSDTTAPLPVTQGYKKLGARHLADTRVREDANRAQAAYNALQWETTGKE